MVFLYQDYNTDCYRVTEDYSYSYSYDSYSYSYSDDGGWERNRWGYCVELSSRRAERSAPVDDVTTTRVRVSERIRLGRNIDFSGALRSTLLGALRSTRATILST